MALTTGGEGNDSLDGGAGTEDTINGGGGIDTVSYANAGPVTVFLFNGVNGEAVETATGTVDTLISVENVIGSNFDDLIVGDSGANVIQGGGGADLLFGGEGGDVFEYSFDFTEGGGETFSFTEFFASQGGSVVNGEVADGTKQGQFSSLYTKWLEMLIREEGLGTDVLDLGQNSGINGTPVIANMTGEFGERESFTWTSGSGKKAVTHERWYSDTWSAGGGEDSVTSDDGKDTILDFGAGDLLDFSGITEAQFVANFNVDASQDVNGDLQNDTVITINGSTDWSLTLSGVTSNLLAADAIVFSS